MTTCTDVYVRPQSCGAVSIYPSQVHPHGGGGGRRGFQVNRIDPRERRRKRRDDEEALLVALLLPYNEL